MSADRIALIAEAVRRRLTSATRTQVLEPIADVGTARQLEALRLRKLGRTFGAIGTELGIRRETAWRLVHHGKVAGLRRARLNRQSRALGRREYKCTGCKETGHNARTCRRAAP